MPSLWYPPAKHVDLLPQDQIFCFQLRSRPEKRSQEAKNSSLSRSVIRLSLPCVPCVDAELKFRYTQAEIGIKTIAAVHSQFRCWVIHGCLSAMHPIGDKMMQCRERSDVPLATIAF